MAVKVGDSELKSHTLDMGVPQGSVVVPMLFSIMLHDIQRVGRPGLSISLYADDLAIWADCPANKNHRRHALERFRQSIDHIQTYMKSNGFELSAEKTVLMVFTREIQSREDFWVRIGGTVVQPSKQAKFLGVTITQSLSWMPLVRSLITKARRATSMIKLLKGETWVTPRSLVHLTRALVRSRLTYGHEALSPQQTHCGWTLNELSWRLSRRPLGCRDMPSTISFTRKWDGCPYKRKVASGVSTSRPVPV